MLINSLAALALGFALDMLLGDPEVVVYPQYFIKKLVAKLDKSFRNSYKNTPEAQRMAGLMMTVIVLLIVAAVALLLLFVGYKLNAALGIFLEGIMCWSALSVKSLKTAAGGVMRAARAGNLSSAQRKVKKVTFRDTDDMNIDAVIKYGGVGCREYHRLGGRTYFLVCDIRRSGRNTLQNSEYYRQHSGL